MVATVTFNPYQQSVGNTGLFNTISTGLRQGTAYPDPSTRFRLRAGLLATTETLPMWGGVGVYASIPGSASGGTTNPSYTLGTILGRAVSLNDASKPLAGFSVFDEAYAGITSPQSTVPLYGSGQQVNYYPLGSLARIALQCDPSLISLKGGPINQNVSWDFTNQLLVPYLGTLTISSGTYNNTTGVVALTMAVAPTFDAGDSITIAGLTGTGAFASLDGTYTVTSISGSVVSYQAATGLGATTITGGTLTVGGAASQALPVKILDIQATNCEVVSYVASTGFANWTFNGACAVVQI
jgi:hypothetical protein